MSKRAANARKEGRYPKTDFRKEYNVTTKSFDAMVSLGIINDSEWHHTSMYGNKTTFYGWEEDEYASIYKDNKKEIDKLAIAASNDTEEAEARIMDFFLTEEEKNEIKEKEEKALHEKAKREEERKKRIMRDTEIRDAMANDYSVDTGTYLQNGKKAGAFRTSNGYAMLIRTEPLRNYKDVTIYNEGQSPYDWNTISHYSEYFNEVDPEGEMRKQMMEEYNARLAEVTDSIDKKLSVKEEGEDKASYDNSIEGGARFSMRNSSDLVSDISEKGLVGAVGKEAVGKFVDGLYMNDADIRKEAPSPYHSLSRNIIQYIFT